MPIHRDRQHGEFADRARRYGDLDARLANYTRFFAVASLTNAVLADLCSRRARCVWVSQTSIDALLVLGRILETINLHEVAEIVQNRSPSHSLDARLIEMEQGCVELVLESWARYGADRYSCLVAEVDALLRAASIGVLPLQGSPITRIYSQVLRSLTAANGRYPSFARRVDRVSIGHALVEQVRSLPVLDAS